MPFPKFSSEILFEVYFCVIYSVRSFTLGVSFFFFFFLSERIMT